MKTYFENFSSEQMFHNEIDILRKKGYQIIDFWHNSILDFSYIILQGYDEMITIVCDYSIII